MTATQPTTTDAENLLRLEHQVCFALHNATRAFGAVYRDALKDLGLTYPQYLAMMALWEHDELSVKRLGELLRLDSGTLSPLLKRLESAGLVKRERSALDERSVLVSVTAAGTALRERATDVPLTVAARTGLDREGMSELRTLLDRLTDRLDAGPAQEC
ncbi:MarR family transcriptional regulator [Streptacidiphilus pinicola]|uniref:MarR family transcriptional regulator n=1 Tax=Streptacidiphilus pinicola TaxID=2219663 RepID=A0A2X0K3S0_9ACTN|nr:MarR family transcriptional regulator [Streptacidiphilus pinicola]RAG82199.1 MarR family transcriptional regulator [Streptacidiphilus pinicola]